MENNYELLEIIQLSDNFTSYLYTKMKIFLFLWDIKIENTPTL